MPDPQGMRVVWLVVSVAWAVIIAATFVSGARDAQVCRSVGTGGAGNEVEGVVEQFVPGPRAQHGEESFVIGGRGFSYFEAMVAATTIGHFPSVES